MFMFNSFAVPTPISSVVVQSVDLSYANSEDGSWQYTKRASWISKGKAKIDINLETLEKSQADYTDVILVLDTSGSMLGEKLSQLQTDVNEFINDTVPKGNKISIISFNSDASIVTSFTSDNALLQESVNGLNASGETNYYQALVRVDDVLSTYSKESNRDCVVLFLTDGLPTIDTPNEIAQYSHLKNKYAYLKINGIQYELGDELLTGIKSITDTQFIASTENLNEFLYKASISASASNYESLILTDYIDENYFNLKDIENIDTTFGKVTISDNKIIWNLNNLKSGLDASMTFYINLNDDLIGVGGVYSTSTKTDVSYKINSSLYNESSTKTPVLSDNYSVTYDANAPTGCVVSNAPTTKNYSVFDTVRLDDNALTCTGYYFKEWKIVTDNVEKIGNNQFIMPEFNVTLKAVWKKVELAKSMDGKISKVQTLYKLMADNSIGLDTNVKFNSNPTDANSGIYTIASTKDDKYPVHYYRGNIDNNNVLFAGFCWKMVRTTSTGGVKLIYNGPYSEANKCNNTGTVSQIGIGSFNSTPASPADVGYMYGIRYVYHLHYPSSIAVLERYTIGSNYYYGNSITYSNGTYTLQNATQKSWADNYNKLTGYYTCRSTSTTCSKVYYISGANSSYQYTLSLSGGVTDPATQTINLGKSITDNGNGTYSLTDIVTLKKADWYSNYSTYNNTYKNYYICNDLTSTTCDKKYSITTISNYALEYDNTFNFVYGNDVTWDGTKYTLVDTYTSKNLWLTDRSTLAKKYHYTCFNTTGTCTDVYYIYDFGTGSNIFYLTLSSGKDIEIAKNEMFINTTDSTMKQMIDTWYKNNMTLYTDRLEDTIWCNDRTLSSGALVGKDFSAGTSDTHSYFSSYNRTRKLYSPSIDCPNESRDGFTVSSSSGGNGALTYPVGLLTADEILLAGGINPNSNYYLYTGKAYWLLSPSFYLSSGAYNAYNYSDGHLSSGYYVVKDQVGVRPSVSLASGIKSVDGIGTVDEPFVIE